MAELRERSMQAAQAMSQSGVDLSAAANEMSGPGPAAAETATAGSSSSYQPELNLDVPTTTRESRQLPFPHRSPSWVLQWARVVYCGRRSVTPKVTRYVV